MNIEYEATFENIVKEDVRALLTKLDATLVRPEFMQRRVVFHLPTGHEVLGGWLRVRDEGDRVTMSMKVVDGTAITDQKETCLTVNSFDDACLLLESIGCKRKAYQESKRELWILDHVEVTIDEWPFLEPFVEVEGKSEESVKAVASALGFDWATAKFCAVGTLYSEKYGLPEDVINNKTPEILFGGGNPFERREP
jgi:adenylate cyclase class 2